MAYTYTASSNNFNHSSRHITNIAIIKEVENVWFIICVKIWLLKKFEKSTLTLVCNTSAASGIVMETNFSESLSSTGDGVGRKFTDIWGTKGKRDLILMGISWAKPHLWVDDPKYQIESL